MWTIVSGEHLRSCTVGYVQLCVRCVRTMWQWVCACTLICAVRAYGCAIWCAMCAYAWAIGHAMCTYIWAIGCAMLICVWAIWCTIRIGAKMMLTCRWAICCAGCVYECCFILRFAMVHTYHLCHCVIDDINRSTILYIIYCFLFLAWQLTTLSYDDQTWSYDLASNEISVKSNESCGLVLRYI